jgi:PKD repeat protein
MGNNSVKDPFEDPKKNGHAKKAAKREIYRIISKLHNGNKFDQKGISLQLAALLLLVLLLILLPVSMLTQTVSALSNPTAGFSASPTSGCSPLSVTFTDTSSGNGGTINKWDWDFNGDGTVDHTDTTKPNAFAYIYTSPGTYTAKLTVTTTASKSGTKTTTITVKGSKADFMATPTSGCSPLKVTFTNAALWTSTPITKWEWDFNGDGTIERTDTTATSPFIFTYSTPGTYTVKLTTTTTSCGTNSMTKTSYITAYGPPVADFIATKTGACGSLTFAFADASNGNGRPITGWTWDFGDAKTYNGQAPPDHVYASAGTYIVKLTVSTDCGSNTKIANLIVSSLPVVVPGTYGPACVAGGIITLGGTPTGGTWSGDGIAGNTFNPATAGPGDHVLTYQYTDSDTCTVSKTTTLIVVPLPETTINVDQRF